MPYSPYNPHNPIQSKSHHVPSHQINSTWPAKFSVKLHQKPLRLNLTGMIGFGWNRTVRRLGNIKKKKQKTKNKSSNKNIASSMFHLQKSTSVNTTAWPGLADSDPPFLRVPLTGQYGTLQSTLQHPAASDVANTGHYRNRYTDRYRHRSNLFYLISPFLFSLPILLYKAFRSVTALFFFLITIFHLCCIDVFFFFQFCQIPVPPVPLALGTGHWELGTGHWVLGPGILQNGWHYVVPVNCF